MNDTIKPAELAEWLPDDDRLFDLTQPSRYGARITHYETTAVHAADIVLSVELELDGEWQRLASFEPDDADRGVVVFERLTDGADGHVPAGEKYTISWEPSDAHLCVWSPECDLCYVEPAD